MNKLIAIFTLLFSHCLMSAELMVSKAFVQANVPGSDNTIAYMKLSNQSEADITVVAAQASFVKSAELHSHVVKNDRMQMRQVESIVVPAKSTVALSPNGYHLMLIGLKRRIKPDERVEVSLSFSDKTSQTVELIAVDTRKHQHHHH